jgi:hypothetical protein
MSSFYAELTVDGQTPYPLRQCQFEFTQATDQRGRAAAKVRHGLLHLTLDVPTDDQLLDWANTVHKPLSGHITFFEDDRRTARETMRFAAGQCVSYQESFVAGDAEVGAYVCQLIITSDGLTLAPGGPAQAFVAPAARDHELAATITKPKVLAVPVGGRGPNGFGDTRGKFSGRVYDAENCGGPIQTLDWRTAVIQAEGIATVQKHVERFGPVRANQKMIGRLEQISRNKLIPTDYDRRYYTHELREYERYQALQVPDGIDAGYEIWNDAHSATLEDYQLNEQSQPLYHPDITDEDFE